jgi:hypothetical protein
MLHAALPGVRLLKRLTTAIAPDDGDRIDTALLRFASAEDTVSDRFVRLPSKIAPV